MKQPRQKFTSEVFLINLIPSTQKSSFLNVKASFKGTRKWLYRSPLFIKFICSYSNEDPETYTINLVKNGSSVYNFTTANDSDGIIRHKLPNGYKLNYGDYYKFTASCSTSTTSDIVIYLEGEYEIIDDRVYYEGTSVYWDNVSSSSSVGYLGAGNCTNSILYPDVNSAYITGVAICSDSNIDFEGMITVYINGVSSINLSYSIPVASREVETYIPFGDKSFWMNPNLVGMATNEKAVYTIGLTDSNNNGADASARFIGYRRQLQGIYQQSYIFGFRQVGSTGLQNTSPNWIYPYTQLLVLSRFLRPVRMLAGRSDDDPSTRIGGTIYKDNSDSFYNNSATGQDLGITTIYFREISNDIINTDGNTDTYMRPNNFLSMRIQCAGGSGSDAGYRLICQNSIRKPFLA